VKSKIKFSNEALAAASAGGGNARALRRAAKRRDALATVNPFTVATIGFCDAYIYNKGVLCYTLDDRVRVLDLHNSGDHEVVISIPGLLTQALSDIQDNSRGTFQILYYADRIISCIYRSSGPDSTTWLIAFSIRRRTVLVAEELDSTEKIFVRHNKHYLYFGTNSDVGADGYKKWIIQGFSFDDGKWFEEKIRLPDMVGSEIGSTVCFEFHRKYFYALSNQTSFEVEEIDWTSFYHCVRFPLDSPCKDLLEKTQNEDMWRRQHQEGPIDDRWTFLRLDTDESTGELQIVESRKEWYLGASRSQRTYYTTPIIFPELKHDDSSYSLQDESFSPTIAGPSSTSIPIASSSTDDPEPETDEFDNSSLPNDPILRLRKKDDHPHYLAAPPRNPLHTHPSNDTPKHTLAKMRIRTYHTCSSTFLDLVDDPLEADWRCTQRLRLRGASRKLGPPIVDAETGLYVNGEVGFKEGGVRLWPGEAEWELVSLLNPGSHLGNVVGEMDDRSMVYVTGAADKPQALIFIGFDASVRLKGLRRWGEGTGERESVDVNGVAGEVIDVHGPEDVEERDRVQSDRKGKGRLVEVDGDGTSVQISRHAVDVHAGIADTGTDPIASSKVGRKHSWAWKEKAMYRDIGLGFNFGKAAVPKKGQ